MVNGEDHNKTNLRQRTEDFGDRIIRLSRALPKSNPGHTLANQLLRSGTSVGAHYAEGYRAKSRPDFVNKLVGATQELEETAYWLELLVRAKIVDKSKLEPLKQEINELMSIFVTMIKHTKDRM